MVVAGDSVYVSNFDGLRVHPFDSTHVGSTIQTLSQYSGDGLAVNANHEFLLNASVYASAVYVFRILPDGTLSYASTFSSPATALAVYNPAPASVPMVTITPSSITVPYQPTTVIIEVVVPGGIGSASYSAVFDGAEVLSVLFPFITSVTSTTVTITVPGLVILAAQHHTFTFSATNSMGTGSATLNINTP
jgi:hypothetical protein